MKRLLLLSGLATMVCLSSIAHAQYKYVGPDGSVVYSDQPPPKQAKDVQVKNFGTTPGPSTAGLPYELASAVNKFPVVLYTSPNCPGCDAGRQFLRGRGVPFTERTVTSQEDSAAYKKIAPQNLLPLISVGTQKVTGYQQGTWASLLDDARYPATSVLPASYQNSAPTPLVAPTSADSAPARAAPVAPVNDAPQPSPQPTGNAPSGFKF